ncbi:NAD(P)-binding domain-containing protein [Shigella flexneri]
MTRREACQQSRLLGLGQMGAPMAKNLLKQGHQLNVFDVKPAGGSALVESRPPGRRLRRAGSNGCRIRNHHAAKRRHGAQRAVGEHGVCEGLSRDALVIDMSTIHHCKPTR